MITNSIEGGIVAVHKNDLHLWINGVDHGEFEPVTGAFPYLEQYADERGMRIFRRGYITFYIVGPTSPYWSRASSKIPLFS